MAFYIRRILSIMLFATIIDCRLRIKDNIKGGIVNWKYYTKL